MALPSDNLTQQLPFSQKKALKRWLAVWVGWALLPIPLVWLGFYTFKLFWVAIILYGGVVCSAPIVLIHYKKINHPAFQFRFEYTPVLLIQILVLILLSWLVLEGGWLVFKPSLIRWDTWSSSVAGIGLRPGFLFWALLTYFVFINPVVEEIFWRGILYERFKHYFSTPVAGLLSAFLFGFWHWVIIQYFFRWEWQIPLTLLVSVGGVVFTVLYDRTKSLLPGILVHGLGADLAIMAILWDAMRVN